MAFGVRDEWGSLNVATSNIHHRHIYMKAIICTDAMVSIRYRYAWNLYVVCVLMWVVALNEGCLIRNVMTQYNATDSETMRLNIIRSDVLMWT